MQSRPDSSAVKRAALLFSLRPTCGRAPVANLNQPTTDLTRRFHTIGIENLIFRVPTSVGIQSCDAGRTGDGGGSIPCERQDVLGVRAQARQCGAVGACGERHDRDLKAAMSDEKHGREFHGVNL